MRSPSESPQMCPSGRRAEPLAGRPGWENPAEVPAIGPDEIHIWLAEAGPLEPCLGRLEATLDDLERARCERFRFEKDRIAFLLGRGVLRCLLGRYLGLRPERLRFAVAAHGKPFLEAGPGEPTLRFNLSHSDEVVLLGLGTEARFGVDVERIHPRASLEQIARRFFSPREVAALRGLAPELKTRAFFSCWTRKEAYVKALGEGLSHPLKSFSVSLAPDEPAALLESSSGRAGESWWLEDVSPAPGYAGAVASEGPRPSLRRLRVRPDLLS